MSNAIESLGSLWGPLLVLGQIGLFTLVLLLSIAFLLLLDRKVWAGVMMRKGPNVVGPFGLLQSFADFGKFLLKEIVIPAGANKAVFILAPIVTCTLAFCDLGSHSGGAGHGNRNELGDRRPECRRPLPVRDLVAGCLWHHHGRLGFQLEVSLPRRAALGSADGFL